MQAQGTPASSTRPHRPVVHIQAPIDMRSVSSSGSSDNSPRSRDIPIPTRSAHQYNPEQTLSPSPGEVQRLEQEGDIRTWNMYNRIMNYRAQHPTLRPAAMNVTVNNPPQNQVINVIIENPNRDVNVVIHEDSMEQDMIFKMSV